MGGVYVEESDLVKPNPHLDVPDRDLTTLTGKKLTLVNPAFLTRMIHEAAPSDDETKVHLTGLNPIRPENAPADWEVAALKRFESGDAEWSTEAVENGRHVFRYMRPIRTEAPCLKCHARHGYTEGSIRGGISVVVDLARYEQAFDVMKSNTRGRWLTLFGSGVGFIGISFLLVHSHERRRNRAEAELRRSEALLKDGEERFRTLFEAAGDAFYLADVDGRLIAANAEAERQTGYTKNELLALTVHEVDALESAESLPAKFARARPGDIFAFESLHRRKDGSVYPVDVRVVVVEIDGRPTLLGLARDATERKRAEEALLKAKESAETADRSKSEFLANMSHEIRTPLNGLAGMLQLLAASGLDRERQELIDAGLASAKRLHQLLADILDLSRIESGALAIRTEPFELENLKRAVFESFGQTAKEKGLALDFTVDPAAPPRFVSDEVRLRQILFNLVGNSLKFTDRGGVRIFLSVLGDGAKRPRLYCTVEDDGQGVPEERLDAVFDPFTQQEDAYTRRFQGAGLGLAIVRKLVGLMNGGLCLVSAPGEGLVVHFVIPVQRCSEAVAAAVNQASPASPPKPASTAPRMLVVEDDAVSRIACVKLLEKMGCTVKTAENGLIGLELALTGDFDAVLMDVQMPIMDGLEATRRIRSAEASSGRARLRPPLRIIAMTAYAMHGDRERCLQAGMDEYFSKPVDFAELRRILLDAPVVCPEPA